MLRVSRRVLSVFCPHCQKRLSLEDLTIVGSHPGRTLMTCGDVTVASSASLQLDVFGYRVVVLGRVKGNVTGEVSVEVGPGGRVVGDVRAPRVVVHEGGTLEGRCEMTRSLAAAALDQVASATAESDVKLPAAAEIPAEEEPGDIRPLPPPE